MGNGDTTRAHIVGKIEGGVHGWPFAGSLADLDQLGYRQTEYLIEGEARRFLATTPLGFEGHWQVEPTAPTPFRTRMLVTSPTDPARGNGTLLFEWSNVSAGFDTIICDGPDLLASGFTHVAVSAQHLGAHGYPDAPMGLVNWDPQRYGTLSVPGDTYSYDIFTQAARLLDGLEPLADLPITSTVAVGVSQSASRVATYFNAVQPVEGVFDAFLIVGYFGDGASLEDDSVLDLRNPQRYAAYPRPPKALLRDDLAIPVLVVNSEAEVLGNYPVRQPDTDSYRLWEVAGTPHTPPDMLGFAAKIARDQISMPTVEPPPDQPPRCETTWWPAFLAAMDHFQAWVHGGPPPPSQPRVTVSGDPPAIERDALGIASGGIRLPAIEVPLASHRGAVDVVGPARLSGATLPFPPGVLQSMYPDRETYLARYDDALECAVQSGAVRRADVAGLQREAEAHAIA
jgi:Alpha/beta hydrolase domain